MIHLNRPLLVFIRQSVQSERVLLVSCELQAAKHRNRLDRQLGMTIRFPDVRGISVYEARIRCHGDSTVFFADTAELLAIGRRRIPFTVVPETIFDNDARV